MKFLIDIGHPAHIHYYRNLAVKLSQNGHEVFWTVKDIEIAKWLLDFYGFKYKILPKKMDNLFGKIQRQIQYNYLIYKEIRSKKIDIAIGTSISITHAAKVAFIKSIVFDDDDDNVQPFVTWFSNPLANSLLSPDSLKGKRRRRDTIFYPGFHELAYLHPKVFRPDRSILDDTGLKIEDRFFLLRFNAFKAHHDIGVKGFSLEQKIHLVKILEKFGRVLISTERDIEPELVNYQIKISPDKIHSLMSYATLFIGDSQTMTSEAAVLGIPSIRLNSLARKISYLDEEEFKYKLTYSFEPQEFDRLINKLNELIINPELRLLFQARRQSLLKDKINVTEFWFWFLDNYPESRKIACENDMFFNQFR